MKRGLWLLVVAIIFSAVAVAHSSPGLLCNLKAPDEPRLEQVTSKASRAMLASYSGVLNMLKALEAGKIDEAVKLGEVSIGQLRVAQGQFEAARLFTAAADRVLGSVDFERLATKNQIPRSGPTNEAWGTILTTATKKRTAGLLDTCTGDAGQLITKTRPVAEFVDKQRASPPPAVLSDLLARWQATLTRGLLISSIYAGR